jgi:hypothetical protein
MADEERREPGVDPERTPTADPEEDTEGHSMLAFEQARNIAHDRAREAQDWARKEALRKQAERKPERR